VVCTAPFSAGPIYTYYKQLLNGPCPLKSLTNINKFNFCVKGCFINLISPYPTLCNFKTGFLLSFHFLKKRMKVRNLVLYPRIVASKGIGHNNEFLKQM